MIRMIVGSVLITIGILLVFVGIVSISSKNPTALDVYQGNTTLEITLEIVFLLIV